MKLIADFYKAKKTNDSLKEEDLYNLLDLFCTSDTSIEIKANSIYDMMNTPCYNILIVSFNQNKLLRGRKSLKGMKGISIVSSADNNFEIVSNLSMFKKVRYSVAMCNAKDVIKRVYVCYSKK